MSLEFLKQTAKDYDMSLSLVKRIAEQYPFYDEFYKALEQELINRQSN
jgi:cytidylate kinase